MFNIILPIGAGLFVGFLIGLTGMGGGALMTPFLLIVMKLNPVLAVGTDLTFAAVTKMVGSIQHRRENNVSFRRVAWTREFLHEVSGYGFGGKGVNRLRDRY